MSLLPFVHIDASLEGRADGDEVELTADEAHHLTAVLRLGTGDPVEVADGTGNRAGGELTARSVRLLGTVTAERPQEPQLILAQALPKGRKLDAVVRQVTELGTDVIVPIAAERSVVRLTGPKADRAVTRWTAVARAACEQARRASRPRIDPIASVDGLAELAAAPGTVLLVAHPGAPGLPRHLGAAGSADRAVVAIGPEGGFTSAELTTLERSGAIVVGLGTTTLRTEHAAAAAIAVLAAGLGRWE